MVYYKPYYDEDGNYHHHDGNKHIMRYSCSKGHIWSERTFKKCPSCNYGNKLPEITIKKEDEDI